MPKIEISYETADDLVLSVLKDQYSSILLDISALKIKKTLKPHEEEDLKYNKKLKKHFAKVIRYFMTQEEAERFFV